MAKRLTPYDREPRWRKVLLWFRHMPWGYCQVAWYTFLWIVKGCQTCDIGNEETGPWILTRRECAHHIWASTVSVAEMRMGRYYTTQELLDDLRAESAPSDN